MYDYKIADGLGFVLTNFVFLVVYCVRLFLSVFAGRSVDKCMEGIGSIMNVNKQVFFITDAIILKISMYIYSVTWQ